MMLYQYLALGLHALWIIAAFFALKYAAKRLKNKHELEITSNHKSEHPPQSTIQTSKCQLFTFLMKSYTIINLITGIKP